MMYVHVFVHSIRSMNMIMKSKVRLKGLHTLRIYAKVNGLHTLIINAKVIGRNAL